MYDTGDYSEYKQAFEGVYAGSLEGGLIPGRHSVKELVDREKLYRILIKDQETAIQQGYLEVKKKRTIKIYVKPVYSKLRRKRVGKESLVVHGPVELLEPATYKEVDKSVLGVSQLAIDHSEKILMLHSGSLDDKDARREAYLDYIYADIKEDD